jgi:Baseplate J-like protein
MAFWAAWDGPDTPVPAWNGLDDVQVSDDQRTLTLHFLGKAPAGLRAENVVIAPAAGGALVKVLSLRACREDDPSLDDCVEVRVERPGGWGEYRLCLRTLDERGRPTTDPFPGFDARLACLTFSFKVHCPSDLDCAPEVSCPPEVDDEPDLNYLARDYASLRQLLLDRMARSVPSWRERHVPDLGVTLVELMAYAGDRFSAAQDAVATEAYLSTARLRRSVKRHARLVDYRLHDGCNARTFVQVQVRGKATADIELDPAPGDLQFTSPDGSAVFEPLLPGPVHWWAVQNEIALYTWGEGTCMLPRGATRAALLAGPLTEAAGDNPLHLHAGDFLLLEEVLGPRTGQAADARPQHRQVVRLTRVEPSEDRLYGVLVLNVEWGRLDALTFDLCLTGQSPPPACLPFHSGVARGNVLAVDHGASVQELLPPVPALPAPPACDDCDCGPAPAPPGPYGPTLAHRPLTFRQTAQGNESAAALMRQDPREALPDLALTTPSGQRWTPRPDLLESGPTDRQFVVELEDSGEALLRFGQRGLGQALEAGTAFTARLRVGSGASGNVGADTLTRLRLAGALQLPVGVNAGIRHPLAAIGGQDPEPLDTARRQAPTAFREQLKRAVIAEDYARLTETLFADRVQRAAATLVWTGLGEQVVLAVDALGTPDAPAELLRAIASALEPYRRLGHTLTVLPARTVGLDLDLDVCIEAHASRTTVQAALLELFGSGLQRDGTPAYFHPDRLSFAEPVRLSRIVAEAYRLPGVRNVTVTSLRRHDRPHDRALVQGELPLGPSEIARLDNDLHRPAHGLLTLALSGGR